MSVEYLEIDSSFRNRHLFPFPGDFEIPISKTGGTATAIDPVSRCVPLKTWQVGPEHIIMAVSSLSTADDTTIIAQFTYMNNEKGLPKTPNYFKNIIMTTETTGERRRVVSYRYIGTRSATYSDDTMYSDTVSFGLSHAFSSLGAEITIHDPTDFISSSNPIVFVPGGYSDDMFPGCMLCNETISESRPIKRYDSNTSTLRLGTAHGVMKNWIVEDGITFTIRRQHSELKTVAKVSMQTITVLTLQATERDFYKGKFAKIENDIINIVSSTFNTNKTTLTLSSPSKIYGSVVIEILSFSYDNFNPLLVSDLSRDGVCKYSIELLHIILPTKAISGGYGGGITNYPYVYITLAFISSSNTASSMYSNNPITNRVLFKIPIIVRTNSKSSFITILGDNTRHIFQFNPNTNLRFSVTLPNGDIFKTVLLDTSSPSEINNELQISSLFILRKL